MMIENEENQRRGCDQNGQIEKSRKQIMITLSVISQVRDKS
jgi:hypothetical protein